ncbi:HEAT repeat domain-containing protein [bacterium]|nr:HEAT repeat domain-containing protein [bacterium]
MTNTLSKARTFAAAMILTVAFAGPSAAGQAVDAAAETDKLFEAVAAYTVGQPEAPLIAVSEQVRRSYTNPQQRQAVEARLLKLLATGTPDCKRFVSRQLWMAGSARSVPALAKLLADEEFADIARYALERMVCPEAGKALRDAAAKAKGATLVGIVNSIGQRRDKDAAGLLAPMLSDRDPQVASAAGWALGRIGTPEGAKALAAARAKATDAVRRVLDDACLLCADTLLADGSKGQAAAIYQKMYAPAEPRRIRIAALRGLAAAEPQSAAPLIIAALRNADRQVSGGAAAMIREASGEATTKALAAELPTLPPEAQALMLAALAQRGDPAARPAVLGLASAENEAVRAAAVAALGDLGSAQDAAFLLKTAVAPGAAAGAARASLARLHGAEVDASLLAMLAKAEPREKAELLRALTARRAAVALPAIFKAASHKDGPVRSAAFSALEAMAGKKELPGLLALLVKPVSDGDRGAASKAAAAACARAKDPQACSALVLDALGGAAAPARCALLRLLPVVPAAKSLAALRAAVKDADEPVRDAAVRALVEWPNADAFDDLLALAASAASQTHRVLAVRGCVRALGLPADRPLDKTAALYARVLKLAERVDEKKLVLAGLADVAHPDALKLIEALLSNPALTTEAQSAAVKVARGVAGADFDLATATLEKVAKTAADDRVKKAAEDAIRDINKYRDYILAWMLSGPYAQAGKNGPALFSIVFDPEKPDAKGVKWRSVSVSEGEAVNLAKILGGEDRVAYLRTTVICPEKLEAVLEVGSDDGIKIWLNGKVIHENNASRGHKPGEDKVKIALAAGANALMLKVVNGSTDWAASARIVSPDGKPIKGLKVVAEVAPAR